MSIAEQLRLQALEQKSADLLAKYLELQVRVEAFEKASEHEARKTLHLKEKPRG